MKTLNECYQIISELNEEAHDRAWDSWVEADEQDDEDLREEASLEQRQYFVELFNDLDEETRQACFKYREQDDDFRQDFDCWYGYSE